VKDLPGIPTSPSNVTRFIFVFYQLPEIENWLLDLRALLNPLYFDERFFSKET
jgi:hypothetical protein